VPDASQWGSLPTEVTGVITNDDSDFETYRSQTPACNT